MKSGSILLVKLDDSTSAVGQIVCQDKTPLRSDVLRVLKAKVSSADAKHLQDLVRNSPTDFEVHVSASLGEKLGVWRAVGMAPVERPSTTWFRQSDDFGNPAVKCSERWATWIVNQPMEFVGKLDSRSRAAEIGVVWSPSSVVNRVKLNQAAVLIGGPAATVIKRTKNFPPAVGHSLPADDLRNSMKKPSDCAPLRTISRQRQFHECHITPQKRYKQRSAPCCIYAASGPVSF